MSDSLQPLGLQHTRLPCFSPSPGVCSNSYSLSWWCHPTISNSATHFSCPQSFPASRPFSVSWLFVSGYQNVGASASALVLPLTIQGWFPLGLTVSSLVYRNTIDFCILIFFPSALLNSFILIALGWKL